MSEQEFSAYQDEVEVVCSMLPDKVLLDMYNEVEEMIKGEVYSKKGFPLSLGGLRGLQHTIMFSFWVRKGKGIKVEEGEMVVCELEESPFYKRYKREEEDVDKEEEKEKKEVNKEEVRGEWI